MAYRLNCHYLNQCRNIVNWTLGNKLQWNFNRNSNIFIVENAFENVVCEMLFISSQPQCVNPKPLNGNDSIWYYMMLMKNDQNDTANILEIPVRGKWSAVIFAMSQLKPISTNVIRYILTHWGRDKWPPFSRQHFQMHFLEWKCVNFDKDFTEVCSQESN